MHQYSSLDGFYAYDPRFGDLNVQRFKPEYLKDEFTQVALTIEGRISNFDLTYAFSHLDRTVDAGIGDVVRRGDRSDDRP